MHGVYNTKEVDDEVDTFKLPRSIRAVKNADRHKKDGRTIIVCLDGTGDKFDDDNSNIVHLVSCLKKGDKDQVSYYQAGIGTYSEGGLSSGFASALDMAVGSGLGLHVRDAYHFLMHSYQEGDKICIFGFSRGAYTARCLAGMVHKVGLLPARNIQQIPFAYEFYKDDTRRGWEQSAEFKHTFSIDVSIYYLGVFDSVASVGFIPRQLPLSSTPTSKAYYFRHAIALDERRAKFKPCHYQAKDVSQILDPNAKVEEGYASKTRAPPEVPKVNGVAKSDVTRNGLNRVQSMKSENGEDHEETEFERQLRHAAPYDTDVLEVWFAGCHADVGGGAVPNLERHKLSQIPLRWMIRQCFECDTGIIFKTKALAAIGLDVHTLFPKYHNLGVPKLGPAPSQVERFEAGLPPRSRRSARLVPVAGEHEGEGLLELKIFGEHEKECHQTGEWLPEQVEDYFDVLSPCNDQLVVAKTWWILELLPVDYRVQSNTGEGWEWRVGPNMGMSRAVLGEEPNLHWTVRHLIDETDYKIKARLARNASWRLVA